METHLDWKWIGKPKPKTGNMHHPFFLNCRGHLYKRKSVQDVGWMVVFSSGSGSSYVCMWRRRTQSSWVFHVTPEDLFYKRHFHSAGLTRVWTWILEFDHRNGYSKTEVSGDTPEEYVFKRKLIEYPWNIWNMK